MARLASATLRVGDAAPPFGLSALDGQRVELTDLLDRGAVLLIFAPGVWSPNVRRQLVELAAAHERFLAAGVQVSMVVTQDRRRVVERLTYVTPPFAVLTDEQRVAARDYGVYRAFSLDGIGVTRPAVFLIDTEGVLRLVYVGEGDADVVDAVTLLRLTCWLVGAPLLPEATLPDGEYAEPVVEPEEGTLVLPPLPLGEGGGDGVPAGVAVPVDGRGPDAPGDEVLPNGDGTHSDETTGALGVAEAGWTNGSGDTGEVTADGLDGRPKVATADGLDGSPEDQEVATGDGLDDGEATVALAEPAAEGAGDGAGLLPEPSAENKGDGAVATDGMEVETKP